VFPTELLDKGSPLMRAMTGIRILYSTITDKRCRKRNGRDKERTQNDGNGQPHGRRKDEIKECSKLDVFKECDECCAND
jgi:hypothetical protein